ncbi:MAG: hypothetical protein JNK45_01600 [Myxococcales bacterium]|nr:hypothetical protein [Myxococcales bacterium]
MLPRNSVRGLLTSTIVALALGGCSFSYSSGSAPPSNRSSHDNHGKVVHKSAPSKKVDNREKALPSSSGEKPITKASAEKATTQPDAPVKADPTPAVEPDEPAAPKRTQTAPKRTKGAPKRTPVADDTAEATESDAPNAGTSFKAKTKPATPPTASDTLVAPQ